MFTSPLWQEEHVIALLAWLDFSLQNGSDFDATIIGALKAATSKDFKTVQVSRLMSRLVQDDNNKSKSNSLTVTTLKTEGSSSLIADAKLRRRIQSRLNLFQENEHSKEGTMMPQNYETQKTVSLPSRYAGTY